MCVRVRVSAAHLDCVGEVVNMLIDLGSQLCHLLPGVLPHLLQLQ